MQYRFHDLKNYIIVYGTVPHVMEPKPHNSTYLMGKGLGQFGQDCQAAESDLCVCARSGNSDSSQLGLEFMKLLTVTVLHVLSNYSHQ